jgi:simple sugar transport system permease protein
MSAIGDFLFLTLTSLVPILAAAAGGMFAERARAPNIALDGCMLMASLAAVVVGATTGNPWLGVLAGIAVGATYAGVLAFAAFVLHCDIIIAGIASNLLATGLSLLIVQHGLKSTGTYAPFGTKLVPRVPAGPLADIPILGQALGNQSALLYVMIAATVLAAVILNLTRFGAHIKAVGESEEAALAVGIKPVLIRTIAVLLSGAFAGIGGAYLSLSSVATFNSDLTGGLGFIAFAAVIFGRASPLGVILASLLFAVATSVAIYLQGSGSNFQQLVQCLPYVATVIALAIQAARRARTQRFGVSDTNYVPAIIPRG